MGFPAHHTTGTDAAAPAIGPGLVARVMRAVPAGPLVNAVHVSVINIGRAFGAWAGGLGIQAGYGLISPLWIGLVLVVIVLVGRDRMHRWALWLPNLIIRQIAGRKAVVAVPESDAR